MEKPLTREQLRSKFPNASPDFIQANAEAFYPPASAEPKQGDPNEPVATPERKAADAVFRVVRITLYRRRLLDGDNPFVKDLVDSLRHAGILFDDTPQWAKIEVIQKLVALPASEGTLVEVM